MVDLTSLRKETLTVEEAARILGIGRQVAYAQARKGWLGPVPVLRVGKRLLVPRRALERALAGDIATPKDDHEA